jgi:hypothetical protein
MKRVAMRILLLFVLAGTSSCTLFRSKCPEIPVFPNAQKLSSVQQGSRNRITIYATSSSIVQVIDFYDNFKDRSGWSINTNTGKSINLGYVTSSNNPAFSLNVMEQSVQAGQTTYEVDSRIQGPTMFPTCDQTWP